MKIKNFTPRLYQETIFSSCSQLNSLVVLPTGMGKTNIFLMLAAHRLSLFPGYKILLLGPTRPLIEQYMLVFKKYLEIDEGRMSIFTGHVQPKRRAELWKQSTLIFSTPQGLENDIVEKRINLKEVCLMGIDEAHRTVGDYAYVFVVKRYNQLADFPLTIGLTASPGSDMEKIEEVCTNLFVENIEIRTDQDTDVKPYVKEIKMEWNKVSLPIELQQLQKLIKNMINERISRLKEEGMIKKTDVNFVSRTEILSLQAQLRGRAANGEKDYVVWNSISILAEVMKLFHGLELLESQGINSLYKYIDSIFKDSFTTKTKATLNISKDIMFKEILMKTEGMVKRGLKHPKMNELIRVVREEINKNKNAKLLIFNQFRDNVHEIALNLKGIENARPSEFIGQAKKKGVGMSQKDQKALIEKFSNGEFNIVIATSIGEEGLDIPKVDTVIFYEPIPSAIRSIQRRGRTGRLEKGKVIILVTKDTRDEAYRWSAHHKEVRMYRNLETIKSKLEIKKGGLGLKKYLPPQIEEEKVVIHVDHREKANRVIKELLELDVDVNLKPIEYSDYALSKRVGVEFKTVDDFVNSIIDGRLMSQVKGLKRNFERPIIIIEGETDIYSVRNMHPNAIRGMISNIIVSYGVPLLQTKNPKETAAIMKIIAKREQFGETKDFEMHFEKKRGSLKEKIEYIVSSIPGVGINTAKDLLKKFSSIKSISNAKEDKLKQASKVGDKTAKTIREVFDSDYNKL